MVERAAMAAHKANRQTIHANAEIEHWDECTDHLKEKYRTIVRAVIESMRDATPHMYGSVVEHGVMSYGGAHSVWEGMIDAALRDQ
jgi:actin-like ATPase involved in cell morphogenesis